MNLRQIDAFRAVMESGTVSRAAKRLSVSQPAVSKLIQSLEQAIGLVLFDRTRGRLSPNAEATMLLEEVERLFGGLSSLKTRITAASGSASCRRYPLASSRRWLQISCAITRRRRSRSMRAAR